MTQEELDALMNGGVDDVEVEESGDRELVEGVKEELESEVEEGQLPLPATDENKMVHQLDDVTKESEEKATQIFDIIENISNDLMDNEESAQKTIDAFEANIKLFTTLTEKFPDVHIFTTSLAQNEEALAAAKEIVETLQNSGDAIMNVMDIMQYQDIHRQKIERVINVMRALSRYMNTLFEGKIEDEKRVSSAKHIEGDTSSDVASADEIEALLEQFGQ